MKVPESALGGELASLNEDRALIDPEAPMISVAYDRTRPKVIISLDFFKCNQEGDGFRNRIRAQAPVSSSFATRSIACSRHAELLKSP